MPTFTPPSFEEAMPTRVKPLCYFRLTRSSSVVRINGVLTSVRTPSHEQLVAAGTEGVDWFIGGHIYNVSDATATELENAGFEVTP